MFSCKVVLSFINGHGWALSCHYAFLLGRGRLLGAHQQRPYKQRSLTGTLPVQLRHLHTSTVGDILSFILLGGLTKRQTLSIKYVQFTKQIRQRISVALLQDSYVQRTNQIISPTPLLYPFDPYYQTQRRHCWLVQTTLLTNYYVT